MTDSPKTAQDFHYSDPECQGLALAGGVGVVDGVVAGVGVAVGVGRVEGLIEGVLLGEGAGVGVVLAVAVVDPAGGAVLDAFGDG